MSQLTLVPSPIGNLEDITLRALKVLQAADIIAAEDTRHSATLLRHHQITTPTLRLDAHTMTQRGAKVLSDYAHVAYLSDAGTPGISDPGLELLQLALSRGDTVDVLPGATAFVPALILSGLPLAYFAFEGFLPRKGKARRERLERIIHSPYTTTFYESPHRLVATLDELLQHCDPERQASVSRELSKRYQTTYRGSLRSVRAQVAEGVKGEVVIVLAGVDPTNTPASDALDPATLLEQLQAQGLHGKALRSALRAALQASGMPRNAAYQRSLELCSSPDA